MVVSKGAVGAISSEQVDTVMGFLLSSTMELPPGNEEKILQKLDAVLLAMDNIQKARDELKELVTQARM
jgi:hypothetical protein